MTRMLLSAVIALVLTGPASDSSASHGADTLLPGTGLAIHTPASGKNKITFRSRSSAVDSGRGGTTGDPTCGGQGGGGAVLQVAGLGGSFVIALPCGGWRQTNDEARNADYLYRDTSGATCSRVVIKHGRVLQLSCRGAQVAYALGQPQGDVSVTLLLGSAGERSCATFGPPPTHVVQDGSNGRVYVAREAPEAAACPAP